MECQIYITQNKKEILHLASKVQNAIHKEIGDSKFCILVDEVRDESKREQMTIILRFVDTEGFIKEYFFHVVYGRDTTTLILKKKIFVVLSRYNIHIKNNRGQGYMMELVICVVNGMDYKLCSLKFFPYAYYIHCMAYRLQLALVTTSREVKVVH